MVEKVAGILIERGETLSTAESCTGGLVSATCTAISGSSIWFVGGVVSYSNDIKNIVLGVSNNTLKEFGAVSKNTVSEMLSGALKLTRSDWSIAISGIAGPTGGTKDKPVGTVFIGVGSKGISEVREFHFNGNRDEVRTQSVDRALSLLLEVIDGKI